MSEERILFIRGGAVGDFVLTLPLLATLRRTYPDASMEVLGYPPIAELAVGRGLAQSAARVDAAEMAPLFSRSGTLEASQRAYFAGFSRVVCIWPDHDGTIEVNLKEAGVKAPIMIDPLPEPGGPHAVDHVLGQAGRLGLPTTERMPRVRLNERDRWWAERYMRVSGAGYASLLGMHVGSGSPKKNWPVERFREVAQDWLSAPGRGVLLTQGPAEDEAPSEVAAALPEDAAWVLRNEALPRVAAVLERCEVYLGNDSGITHLAASVGVPTVAVFGPSDPKLWRPVGRRVTVVGPATDDAFPDVTEVQRAVREAAA